MNTIFCPITTTSTNVCSKNKYAVQTTLAKRSTSAFYYPISFPLLFDRTNRKFRRYLRTYRKNKQMVLVQFSKTKKDNSWRIHKLEEILAGEILWFWINCWIIKFLVPKDHNRMWNLPEENFKNKTTFSNNERSVFDEVIPTNKG